MSHWQEASSVSRSQESQEGIIWRRRREREAWMQCFKAPTRPRCRSTPDEGPSRSRLVSAQCLVAQWPHAGTHRDSGDRHRRGVRLGSAPGSRDLTNTRPVIDQSVEGFTPSAGIAGMLRSISVTVRLRSISAPELFNRYFALNAQTYTMTRYGGGFQQKRETLYGGERSIL